MCETRNAYRLLVVKVLRTYPKGGTIWREQRNKKKKVSETRCEAAEVGK